MPFLRLLLMSCVFPATAVWLGATDATPAQPAAPDAAQTAAFGQATQFERGPNGIGASAR